MSRFVKIYPDLLEQFRTPYSCLETKVPFPQGSWDGFEVQHQLLIKETLLDCNKRISAIECMLRAEKMDHPPEAYTSTQSFIHELKDRIKKFESPEKREEPPTKESLLHRLENAVSFLESEYKREWETFHTQKNYGRALVSPRDTTASISLDITKELRGDVFYFLTREGYMSLRILTEGPFDRYYQSPEQSQSQQKKQFVFLEKLFPKKPFNGVGTALLQTAIEEGYTHGCEGRLVLSASYSSHAFYYVNGLRSQDATMNKKIAEIVETNRRLQTRTDTRNLYAVTMFLPPEAISEWEKRIKEHPILDVTRARLGAV